MAAWSASDNCAVSSPVFGINKGSKNSFGPSVMFTSETRETTLTLPLAFYKLTLTGHYQTRNCVINEVNRKQSLRKLGIPQFDTLRTLDGIGSDKISMDHIGIPQDKLVSGNLTRRLGLP